ncbi:MAG: hypothetical protein U9R07_14525 [Pseudomonadota bacterium]|nr:hypothetical protein [Pseudomonadota bacterium]
MNRDRLRRSATAFALGLSAAVSLVMASCSEPRAADPAVEATDPEPIELIAPTDSVEDLTADPERLATVQEGCSTNQPWATEQLCVAAAEARRRRFRGEGVPYTPQRTDPFPSRPEPSASSPPVRTQ